VVSTATAAQTLDSDAFNQLVLEKELKTWTQKGYIYAGFRGARGWELYRTLSGHKWIYQAQVVVTNANAAGAAIVVDISLASGQVGKLIGMNVYSVTTGTHTLYASLNDEDLAAANHNLLIGNAGAAAAAKVLAFPSIGTAATASVNLANSTGLVIPPGAALSIYHTDASGVANDHIDIFLIMELYNLPTLPTWSKARSGNAADVTIAASSISAANTIQPVVY